MANTREVFEIAFQLCIRQAQRTKDGAGYLNPDIQSKWEGWQARERLTAAPVQTPEQMARMVETVPTLDGEIVNCPWCGASAYDFDTDRPASYCNHKEIQNG